MVKVRIGIGEANPRSVPRGNFTPEPLSTFIGYQFDISCQSAVNPPPLSGLVKKPNSFFLINQWKGIMPPDTIKEWCSLLEICVCVYTCVYSCVCYLAPEPGGSMCAAEAG